MAGDAIFLDARSVDEFDRSHISGAWSFSERSPLWARLASEREDLERTSEKMQLDKGDQGSRCPRSYTLTFMRPS